MKFFKNCILIGLILAAGCTDKNESHTEKPDLGESGAFSRPIGEVSARFNAEDAATAFRSFNEYYYNEDAKLYYSSTEHIGPGSIWTQAIFWDIVMHTYEHTEEPQYLEMIHDIYQGGYDQYDGYNWENEIEWFIYDDIMWWVISLARAYEITGEELYLENSITGFDRVWEGSYDPDQSGMYWDFHHSGKNACINYPTVIAAMRLFNLTGEESYLEKAREIYNWSQKNLFDPESGRIADHISAGGNIGYEDYTYNQGTAIGAAVMLYQETGDESYLADARKMADYTRDVMSDENGILPAEGDWNEQGVLKAIFAHYMKDLIDEAGQEQYRGWMIQNANTAWENRDPARGIMHRDYTRPAPTGIIQSYESSSGVALMRLFAD